MRAPTWAILTGFLLLAPAAWALTCAGSTSGGSNITNTQSTTPVYTTTVNNVTQQVNTFQTELKARMQGASFLFDQTYNVAVTDPTVQTAITQAKNVLTGAGAVSFTGPTLLSSNQSTTSSVSTTNTTTGANVLSVATTE